MADLSNDTSLKIALDEIEKKVIQAEIDRNNLETILGTKDVEIVPGSKMSSLIDKVDILARRGSGYLPNQPFNCELGYMDMPQKFIFLHYYDNKMKLFCRDNYSSGDIYYNTIDLKSGISDGWQIDANANLSKIISNYRYPIRGKHPNHNWISRYTSSTTSYYKIDSNILTATIISNLDASPSTRTSVIYREGDVLYYFKSTDITGGHYVKLCSYDLTTNTGTELYNFGNQVFLQNYKSITVKGDSVYFHLSKSGENRNIYFYKYSLSNNSLEELGIAKVDDIDLNLLSNCYLVYKKYKLYIISSYLASNNTRCKILEFNTHSGIYKSYIFSLGQSSTGLQTPFENYVFGDNENIWLKGVNGVEKDSLFLRLNIN